MSKAKLSRISYLSDLPDLFCFNAGGRVQNERDWEIRRGELLGLAVGMQYGGMPPEPEFLETEALYISDQVSSYRIHTGRRAYPVTFIMQIVMPGIKQEKYPAIIDGDGCFPYVYLDSHLQLASEFGAILVRFNRTELAHDIKEDVHTDGLYACYPGAGFSALAAWAWGYSRCVDALMQLGIADASLIAFTGHSRGGKTALLAGACDTRATVVNPNGSGAGGAGCYRVHSETVCEDGQIRRSEELSDLLRNFPHWFGKEMTRYADHEAEIPFDEHFLKALVAPRWLLDTEAASDAWANPAGAYLTNLAASEAFRLFGMQERILYHLRDGYHHHDASDFAILLNVMEHIRSGAPLDQSIGETPFGDLPPLHEWRCPKECVGKKA